MLMNKACELLELNLFHKVRVLLIKIYLWVKHFLSELCVTYASSLIQINELKRYEHIVSKFISDKPAEL